MSPKLNITEAMVELIQKRIHDNIQTQLDALAVYRNDKTIQLQAPRSYFIFDDAVDLQCPAIFILPRTVDFANEKGQNHINADQSVQVSIVFEAPDKDKCTRGLWRYVDALFNVLDHWQLSTDDGRSKNVLICQNVEYSDMRQVDQNQNIFRKEAMMILKVVHWQSLND